MAARSLSARLCRQCCRTDAAVAQRRFNSTAARPAGESDLQQQQQQQDVEESTSPVASTSKAGAEEASLLSSLKFEISQASPVISVIWARLHELHQTSPSTLARQEDLMRSAIPVLSRYNTPRKDARGLAKIVDVQEEAEALYARYRFISNRLKAAGAFQRNSALENDEFLLVWLKGIAALGYGPAAWRIWTDYKQMANPENITRLARPMAHSVLVATMKWVVLQRDRDVQTLSFQSHAKQCLQQANEVVQFLKERDQYDWIARSLIIRILKETESIKELLSRLKEEYSFDPNFPSLVPFDANTGQEGLPAAKLMDPHIINTILHRFAMESDLSKMISLFETAIGHSTATARVPKSGQVPFFSSSADFASAVTETAAVSEQAHEEPTASEESTMRQQNEDLPATKPLDLTSVNTHSFNLLISQAIAAGRIQVAHHYLKLCVTAWEQERLRLRSAYESLYNWTDDRDAQKSLTETSPRIAAPRVSISIHSFYPIYMQLKHSKHEKQRYTPVLASCLRMAQTCLDLLKEDAIYFARAYDNLARIEDTLTPESRAQIKSRSRGQHRGRFEKDMDLKTHVLLQARLQVELGELARFMEIATMDVISQRTAGALLSKLSLAQTVPEGTPELDGYTMKINRLNRAIRNAENWIADNLQDDRRRLVLLRRTLGLSAMQMEAKVREKRMKYARRRALVAEAVTMAQVAVKEAVAARRELLERNEAQPESVPSATTSRSGEASESSLTSLNVGNLQMLHASSRSREVENVHAAPQGNSPHLVLC